MKRKIAALGMAGLFFSASAWGSGYRIPEQSVNSTALSGAYVANASSGDASYFNPANMGWLDQDRWSADLSLTYINLASIDYSDSRTDAYNGGSRSENFIAPQFHLVSPDFNHFRLGLSLVEPAGLAKRWEQPYPRTFAEDFTLKVVELNPVLSYTMADKYGVAVGIRLLRGEGKVVSRGTVPVMELYGETLSSSISRSMEGDTLDYGYNLAITAKASDKLTFAVTYRSNVNLGLESNAATLTNSDVDFPGPFLSNIVPAATWTGRADVTVPVPAVLTAGASYTFGQTTVELVWDRTFWSEYDNLDFDYPTSLPNPVLIGAFDAPKDKGWANTDAFRIGITHRLHNDVTLMAGCGFDENPVPEHNLNFELPDSNALLFSLGARFRINERLELGVAYLYDHKDARTVTLNQAAGIDGTFDNAAAQLLSLGAAITF